MTTVEFEFDSGSPFHELLAFTNWDWMGEIKIPVQATESIEESIKAVQSTELDAEVRRRFAPDLWIWSDQENSWDSCYTLFLTLDRTDAESINGIAIWPVVDLIDERGAVVDTIEPEYRINDSFGRTQSFRYRYELVPLTGRDEKDLDFDAWTVRVRGDARLSLAEFDRETYWAGSLEFRLSETRD